MENVDLPSGYTFDERGLVQEKDGTVIANFFLAPTKVYQYQDDMVPRFCDIEVVCTERRIPIHNHLALAVLTPTWWKSPPPGCCYLRKVRSSRRCVENLFQMLLGKIEPLIIFQPAVLGWDMLPSGEHVYVTGKGAIGPNGYMPEEQMWIPDAITKYQIESSPTDPKETQEKYFWDLYRMMLGITDILLANVFAAILFPCFKAAGVESRFPIILEGPSESKKTTLACLTSCLYNRKSSLRSSVATLTSTSRALERRGIELRHTVQVFDDLFPDGGSKLEAKALELIRDIANQVPREACAGKALEGSAMECGAVITAEAFPDCGRSTRTRCLRIKLEEPVPNALLNPLQERPELLGGVFERFITSVSKNFQEITDMITRDFRLYRQERAGMNTVAVPSERHQEIGFVLYTALKIFLTWEYGENPSLIEEELADFNERLGVRINWQLSPQAAPGRGYLITAIAELIKRYPQGFPYRQGCFCIPPGQLCELLQHYCGDETISVAEINRQLRNEQLLSMDRSGAATKKIKGLGRCLCIDRQKLFR